MTETPLESISRLLALLGAAQSATPDGPVALTLTQDDAMALTMCLCVARKAVTETEAATAEFEATHGAVIRDVVHALTDSDGA